MAECDPDFAGELGPDAVGVFASDRPTGGFQPTALDPAARATSTTGSRRPGRPARTRRPPSRRRAHDAGSGGYGASAGGDGCGCIAVPHPARPRARLTSGRAVGYTISGPDTASPGPGRPRRASPGFSAAWALFNDVLPARPGRLATARRRRGGGPGRRPPEGALPNGAGPPVLERPGARWARTCAPPPSSGSGRPSAPTPSSGRRPTRPGRSASSRSIDERVRATGPAAGARRGAAARRHATPPRGPRSSCSSPPSSGRAGRRPSAPSPTVSVGAVFGVALVGASRSSAGARGAHDAAARHRRCRRARGRVALVVLALATRWPGPWLPFDPAGSFMPWAAVTVLVATAEEVVLRGALFDALDEASGTVVALARDLGRLRPAPRAAVRLARRPARPGRRTLPRRAPGADRRHRRARRSRTPSPTSRRGGSDGPAADATHRPCRARGRPGDRGRGPARGAPRHAAALRRRRRRPAVRLRQPAGRASPAARRGPPRTWR